MQRTLHLEIVKVFLQVAESSVKPNVLQDSKENVSEELEKDPLPSSS